MADPHPGNLENKSATKIITLTPPKYDGDVIHQIIKENIKSLEEINASGVKGVVKISMKIEDDGSLTNLTILKGLSPETDAEALRVVKLLPNKEPLPKQDENLRITGRSTTVYITFPYKSPFDH
jgi:TonB family protein